MATKNLARTVIEGGRLGEWRNEIKLAKRHDRRSTKLTLKFASFDERAQDALSHHRLREDTGFPDKFNDKLHVPLVWLMSQVGRPWNEVRSKLYRKYGGNKIRNHHLREHLLAWVNESPSGGKWGVWGNRFQVDMDGILCKSGDFEYPQRRERTYPKAPQSWPPHRNKDAYAELPWFDQVTSGIESHWAVINDAGEPHWVCAVTWGQEVNENNHLVRFPISYRYARPFFPDETNYLRSLPMRTYRKLFLSEIIASRRGTNRVRHARRLPPLPEITLID